MIRDEAIFLIVFLNSWSAHTESELWRIIPLRGKREDILDPISDDSDISLQVSPPFKQTIKLHLEARGLFPFSDAPFLGVIKCFKKIFMFCNVSHPNFMFCLRRRRALVDEVDLLNMFHSVFRLLTTTTDFKWFRFFSSWPSSWLQMKIERQSKIKFIKLFQEKTFFHKWRTVYSN